MQPAVGTEMRRKRHEFWLTLLLGGIFCVTGLAVALIFGYLYSQRATQIEQLPAVSAAALSQRPLGSQVLVEGRLSRRNEIHFRSFVAYRALEFRGWDTGKNRSSRARWAEIARVTPPLHLELADGPVQIANRDYRFQSGVIGSEAGPVTWQDTGKLTWNSQTKVGTRRYTGFEIGSPVLALGSVIEGPEGRAIEAKWIYGGSRAGYLAQQRGAAQLLAWIGPLFVLVGLLITSLGLWRWKQAQESSRPGRRRQKKGGKRAGTPLGPLA